MQHRKSPLRRIALWAAVAALAAGPAVAKPTFGLRTKVEPAFKTAKQVKGAGAFEAPKAAAFARKARIDKRKVARVTRATNPRNDGFRLLRQGDHFA